MSVPDDITETRAEADRMREELEVAHSRRQAQAAETLALTGA
ncbi:hypothetical protein [Streptomyces sp. Ac-502]